MPVRASVLWVPTETGTGGEALRLDLVAPYVGLDLAEIEKARLERLEIARKVERLLAELQLIADALRREP